MTVIRFSSSFTPLLRNSHCEFCSPSRTFPIHPYSCKHPSTLTYLYFAYFVPIVYVLHYVIILQQLLTTLPHMHRLQMHISLSIFHFFFFWPCHETCGILVPWPGIKGGPRQWKCRVLINGPPGNSLTFFNWRKHTKKYLFLRNVERKRPCHSLYP